MNPPRVSVLIVTWNSQPHLPHCLDCLRDQTFKDFEVLIVDNGSSDRAIDGVKQAWPELAITIRTLDRNLGFAAGNNLAARMAGGKWLALLNADAYPEPDWLERLLAAAQAQPGFTSFASRLIQANAPTLLDGEGDDYHVSGLAWRRNHGKTAAPGGGPMEVFSACAAAALYKRSAFLDLGGFDEEYFSYNEDVDLGFRLRLAGQRCLFVPDARVRHVGSASFGVRSDNAIYYGHRNLVWTFFKDMPAGLLLLFLPAHLAMTLTYLAYFTCMNKGPIIIKAKWDAYTALPRVWQQRRPIQNKTRLSWIELFKRLNKTWLPLHWIRRLGRLR